MAKYSFTAINASTDYQIAKTHVHFHTVCHHITRKRAKARAVEGHDASKSVPLLTHNLRFHFVWLTHSMCFMRCDVYTDEVKWRWQLRKVRLKWEKRAHKAEYGKQYECFATLNRPSPSIFSTDEETQTVKIETFDLWPANESDHCGCNAIKRESNTQKY